MKNDAQNRLLKDLSQEELDLLISATAAYQHNDQYRSLHSKLLQQRSARKT